MSRPRPAGFDAMLQFPLMGALTGRRSRRFFMGAEIPDGVMAYASKHDPMPLDELERIVLLSSMAGNTGWNNLIYRHAAYAPHLSNYAGAAGGRTFPSAAGFHTSQLFFTHDEATCMFDTRDAPALVKRASDGSIDPEEFLAAHRPRIRTVYESRLDLPPETPHVEGHNTWVANQPGTMLAMPVADLAQHIISNLCYYLQNETLIYDDINNRPIPGLERYAHLAPPENVLPLSFLESLSLAEATAELSTSCYAGTLMLQAMGLGGWMFNGLNPFSVLGASAGEGVRGLGMDYQQDERWPLPNVTGLPGLFEATCPPNVPDMAAAVEIVCERKFGPGGPFNPATPGPFKDTAAVRGAAQVHNAEFRECVTLQAQYVYDTFGRFPATQPAMYVLVYLQAQHIDLDFYDEKFKPGAYLETHARHMDLWHPE